MFEDAENPLASAPRRDGFDDDDYQYSDAENNEED